MGRPSQQDKWAIAELEHEAARLSLGAPRFDVAEHVRRLLEVEAVATYEVELHENGPRTIAPRVVGAVPRAAAGFHTLDGNVPSGAYTLARPESAQRNRVLLFPSFRGVLDDPGSVRPWFPGETRAQREAALEKFLEYSALWRRTEVFELAQLRVLLCERDHLLMYVNAFHASHSPAVRYRLRRARTALRRRLQLERQLAYGAGERLVLEAALDHVGRAAFVLGPRGQLLHANAAGRATYRSAVASVRAAIRGEPSGFQVTRVGQAASSWYLAVERRAEPCAAGRARAAAARWELSAPQARVLVAIVEGSSNKSIAAELGLAENTVEYHVTRILARIGVPHRAALVARVWIETS